MKKFIAIVVITVILTSLCACKREEPKILEILPEETREIVQETPLQEEVQNEIQEESKEADLYIIELGIIMTRVELVASNDFVQKAFESETMYEFNSNIGEAYLALNESLDLLGEYLPQDNAITIDIETLIEKYQEIEDKMKMYTRFYGEEELNELIFEARDLHISLIETMECYYNLYSIRMYCYLPEEEANLDEYWDRFFFSKEIEKPDSITEVELYGYWVAAYFQKNQLTDEVYEKVGELIKDDDPTSKEANLKWFEFIKKFISTNTEVDDVSAFLNYG